MYSNGTNCAGCAWQEICPENKRCQHYTPLNMEGTVEIEYYCSALEYEADAQFTAVEQENMD